eukprot:scaffold884_cov154-Skeletonema_menzelii.AAC.2
MMISSTRSFLTIKASLFLLTCRSLVMPAAAQKFIDRVTVSDFGKTDLDDDEESSSIMQFTPFTVRLHLIRHGETLANERNIVLGQGDSPLTDKGLALAGISAKSGYLNGRTDAIRYWRTYTSDLYRAHRTAKIVLGLEDIHGNTKDDFDDGVVQQTSSLSDEGVNGIANNNINNSSSSSNNNNIDLIVDPRLRELAKGPREGYLKTLSFEEAMSRRLQEAIKDNRYQLDQKLKVPKLESVSDAWGRATDWIASLVKDAADEYHSSVSSKKGYIKDNNSDPSCNTTTDEGTPEKIYNVFALSHSALIRTMVHKMVDDQLPKNYALTNEGSLLLPNLSRTVIDVRPYYSKLKRNGSSNDRERVDANNKDDNITLRWKYRLVHLADVSHLSADPSINTKPPYL